MQHRFRRQSTVLHFGLFLLDYKQAIKGKIRPSNYEQSSLWIWLWRSVIHKTLKKSVYPSKAPTRNKRKLREQLCYSQGFWGGGARELQGEPQHRREGRRMGVAVAQQESQGWRHYERYEAITVRVPGAGRGGHALISLVLHLYISATSLLPTWSIS